MHTSHVKAKWVEMYTEVCFFFTNDSESASITVSELGIFSLANQCTMKAEILF